MSVPAARWGIPLPPPMRINLHEIDASTRYTRLSQAHCPWFARCNAARTRLGHADRVAHSAPVGHRFVTAGLNSATAGDFLGGARLGGHGGRVDLAGAR